MLDKKEIKIAMRYIKELPNFQMEKDKIAVIVKKFYLCLDIPNFTLHTEVEDFPFTNVINIKTATNENNIEQGKKVWKLKVKHTEVPK